MLLFDCTMRSSCFFLWRSRAILACFGRIWPRLRWGTHWLLHSSCVSWLARNCHMSQTVLAPRIPTYDCHHYHHHCHHHPIQPPFPIITSTLTSPGSDSRFLKERTSEQTEKDFDLDPPRALDFPCMFWLCTIFASTTLECSFFPCLRVC